MQLDIARDLHDTVGQNIGFLRMKLDYLTEQNKEHQSDLVMEISSMSRVANESYDLMRGTLAVLQTQSSEDLLKLLSKYADQVADRSNIDISFSSEGIPLVFSPDRIRHIFYIFRESVSNIEKHAHASKVLVEFLWKKEELTIIITDNGIGYDVSKTYRADAHFGVKFMRERASLLRGNLELVANPSGGTKVIVNIPAGI
jgi:signal transduction histidine kinase